MKEDTPTDLQFLVPIFSAVAVALNLMLLVWLSHVATVQRPRMLARFAEAEVQLPVVTRLVFSIPNTLFLAVFVAVGGLLVLKDRQTSRKARHEHGHRPGLAVAGGGACDGDDAAEDVGWDKRSAGPPLALVGRRCACPTLRFS